MKPRSRKCASVRRAATAFAFASFHAGAIAATHTVVNTDDDGAGSLRQAILAASASADADTIAFAIPGAGPHTIAPLTRLPDLRGTLTIDGYTQPGSAPNTLRPDQGGLDGTLAIEIHGPGNGFGFVLATGATVADVTLRGIALNGFQWQVGGGNAASRLTIEGCYIGTSIDGAAIVSGASAQCISTVGTTRIGGTLPAQRNLLANCGNGAIVVGNGDTVIEGNLIGTDASGERALDDVHGSGGGIIVSAASGTPRLRIGGATPAARNVISGNRGNGGIALFGALAFDAYDAFEIKGNFIGTDWSGTHAIPNGFAETPQFSGGIVLWRSASSDAPAPIGGYATGEANLIAHNYGAGIFSRTGHVSESFDNRGNAVHRNRGIGRANVDIAPAGPTPDDPGDADAGANDRQNRPQILAASLAGNTLTLTYRVDSTTTASAYPLRIDFHADAQGGSGALIGQDSYAAADAQQPRTIALAVPGGVRALPFVAAATDARGYSSELSPAYDVIFEDDFD